MLRDHPELRGTNRLTLGRSLHCFRLALWDENAKRLVSFREARGRMSSQHDPEHVVDITFAHAFDLKGVGSGLPAGTYRVDTEEEQIDGLSFLAYRRLATFIRIPTGRLRHRPGLPGRSEDLAAAQERDLAARHLRMRRLAATGWTLTATSMPR